MFLQPRISKALVGWYYEWLQPYTATVHWYSNHLVLQPIDPTSHLFYNPLVTLCQNGMLHVNMLCITNGPYDQWAAFTKKYFTLGPTGRMMRDLSFSLLTVGPVCCRTNGLQDYRTDLIAYKSGEMTEGKPRVLNHTCCIDYHKLPHKLHSSSLIGGLPL